RNGEVLAGSSERQGDGEGRSATGPGARRAHPAAVQVDQVPDDREPEAEAAMGAGASALRLSEAIEDVGQEFRTDPHPRVLDGDLGVAVGALETDFDTTLPRRELDRVRQQVPYDLLQAVRVAAHGDGDRPAGRRERDRLGLRRRS